jgi:hypothetical protein
MRGNAEYYNETHNTVRIIGRLGDGVNAATVTVNTRSDSGNGSKEMGSENTLTSTITRIASPGVVIRDIPTLGTQFDVVAGTRKTIGRTLDAYYYQSRDLMGFTNPTVYLRKPTGVAIDTDSITVTKNGQTIPFTISEYVTSQGAGIVAIHTTAKVGYYFDEKREAGINITRDVIPSITTVGSINLQDYIFITTDQPNYYTAGV